MTGGTLVIAAGCSNASQSLEALSARELMTFSVTPPQFRSGMC